MKKTLAILLTLVLMVSVLPFGLFTITASAATSGTTGDCTWTLDGTVLTISGNGEMGDYDCLDSVYADEGDEDYDLLLAFDDEFGEEPWNNYVGSPWGPNITEVIINDGVTYIGSEAFCYCSLTTITIPNSVTSVGCRAFHCVGPETVNYLGTETDWEGVSIGEENGALLNATFTFAEDEVPDCLSYTISNGKVTITDCDTSATGELVIPERIEDCPVTMIGESAFEDCTSLTSITIPDSVTRVEKRAFYNCTSLTSITFGDSVTSIGDYAFYYCDNLTSITFGDSVTSIGSSAFSSCTSLTSITVPDSVTSIGDGAFYECVALASIRIPDNIIKIGRNAFSHTAYYDNYNNWENGLLYIGNHLVDSVYCDDYFPYMEGDEIIDEIIIKAGTKTIASGCFCNESGTGCVFAHDCEAEGCAGWVGYDYWISKLILPNSLMYIGASVFDYGDNIGAIYYLGTEEQWNEIEIGSGNDPLLNADIKFLGSLRMVKEGSVRHEGVDKNGNYQSAGIRFKSRVSSEFRKSATELGFVAVPTALLGDMTVAEYIALQDNQALTAKVKGEGMKEVIYAVSTDANGQKYYDYQMMIKGLTREGVAENLLDTEITVVMYAIVDGETVYTDTVSYSYFGFIGSLPLPPEEEL